MKIIRPVLVVVDVQEGFTNQHTEHVIPTIVKIVEECSERRLPIVFTKFHNCLNSPFERLLAWYQVREEPETDFHRDLVKFAHTVIEKSGYSAFTGEFSLMRETAGWETILICGMSTESCILTSAVGAFEQGVRPIVVSDACASNQGSLMHENAIEILKILVGKHQIMTAGELLSKL